MKSGALFLFLAAVLAIAGSRPAAVAGGHSVEVRVLAQVNRYRVENGLPPLRFDERLARAALGHARDMADHDFFAHDGSDQSNSGVRARRAGYGWRAVGENIAGGLASPAGTVDEWMASEGHRHNMLNPVFRDAGIGHFYRADDNGKVRYRHYWVLVLAAGAKELR